MPRGPAPKNPTTRARRNTASTKATLSVVPDFVAPKLPTIRGYTWHTLSKSLWDSAWASPMASQWLDADFHTVFLAVRAFNDSMYAAKLSERRAAEAEYRQQCQRIGLSPLDRFRLQWTIEQAEEATDKGTQRRAKRAAAGTATKSKDPRSGLYAV